MVTNRSGAVYGAHKFIELGLVTKTEGNVHEKLTCMTLGQRGGPDGGSVNLFNSHGSEYSGSLFTGGRLPGPWRAVFDGDDNVCFCNFSGAKGYSSLRLASESRLILRARHT
jgi:hypothetical protein